jgi:hypothetical protein
VAISAEVEELAGNWHAIADLESATRERVTANLATPCIRNARTVLLCAIAAEHAGDRDRSVELEKWAEEIRLEGFKGALLAPQLRLALARGDLARLEEIVDVQGGFSSASWLRLSNPGAVLDAYVALRRREDVERQAAPLLRPGTLLGAFAVRALGQVREDEELIREALERFEAMGLDGYAAETRALLEA